MTYRYIHVDTVAERTYIYPMLTWATDNPAQVLALLREVKIGEDPQYAGELRRLREDSVTAKAFFSRRRGLTIDGIGEALADRGLCSTRPTAREVLDALDQLFTHTVAKKRATRKELRRTMEELTAEERRLVGHGWKDYDCPGCGDIARHSGFGWRGTCECGESYVCRQRRPETIRAEQAAVYEAVSAPF